MKIIQELKSLYETMFNLIRDEQGQTKKALSAKAYSELRASIAMLELPVIMKTYELKDGFQLNYKPTKTAYQEEKERIERHFRGNLFRVQTGTGIKTMGLAGIKQALSTSIGWSFSEDELELYTNLFAFAFYWDWLSENLNAEPELTQFQLALWYFYLKEAGCFTMFSDLQKTKEDVYKYIGEKHGVSAKAFKNKYIKALSKTDRKAESTRRDLKMIVDKLKNSTYETAYTLARKELNEAMLEDDKKAKNQP